MDRFGREHVLLTEQPPRYVERGMAVRQSVASELAASELAGRPRRDASRHRPRDACGHAGSRRALEAAFETELNAIQREKWMTPLDSMRYALLDTIHGTTKFRGAPCGPCFPYDRNMVVSVAGRSVHAPCGRRCRRKFR